MKMGIIGYGNMAHWHKDTVAKIKDLEICGIWDINETARKHAEEDGLFVYNSLDEMLDDSEVNFVLIATDNDVHHTIAIKSMEKGKHVVCEKPITLNCKMLNEMIAVSKKTGMHFTVHQNRRWDTDFCTVKKILENGKLGTPFRIESRVHGSRGISNTWRRKKEKGGGVIYDWGVHLFDQLLLLKKGVNIKSVYATKQNVTTAFVEDGFTAFITFEDDFQALIEVQTSDFLEASRWKVFCENGTAEIYDWLANGKTVCAVCDNEQEIVPFVTASGYTKTMAPRTDDTIKELPIEKCEEDITEFYRNVIDVINKKAEPLITNTEMLNVLRTLEAVFKSIETNQAVACDLII